MTRRFANLNFARQILPAIALLGLVIAVIFIASGLPDRALAPPQQTPPRATGALAKSARVAGAGVVEPSSEIVDVGTALSGLVMQLNVQPGVYVDKGDCCSRSTTARCARGCARPRPRSAKPAPQSAKPIRRASPLSASSRCIARLTTPRRSAAPKWCGQRVRPRRRRAGSVSRGRASRRRAATAGSARDRAVAAGGARADRRRDFGGQYPAG